MPRQSNFWNDSRIEQARRWWVEGLTALQIVERFAAEYPAATIPTRSAVLGMAHRKNWSSREAKVKQGSKFDAMVELIATTNAAPAAAAVTVGINPEGAVNRWRVLVRDMDFGIAFKARADGVERPLRA